MLAVRRILKSFASGKSKVTVDSDNYNLIKDSIIALANGQTPELAPLKSVKNSKGEFYNVFIIDGVEVLYRYDKKHVVMRKDGSGKKESKHEFLMDTTMATKLFDPIKSEVEVDSSLDQDEVIADYTQQEITA